VAWAPEQFSPLSCSFAAFFFSVFPYFGVAANILELKSEELLYHYGLRMSNRMIQSYFWPRWDKNHLGYFESMNCNLVRMGIGTSERLLTQDIWT
jgi:hypothetical protein